MAEVWEGAAAQMRPGRVNSWKQYTENIEDS